ncbi:21618_t:CDS:10, partial [Entrophospora sp. SA101]
ISKLLQSKKTSSTNLVEKCLSRITKYNDKINAFISIQDKDELFNRANEADQRFNRGKHKGHLDGIPIAYKDVFCTKELNTTCASNMLKDFKSPYNASVVEYLNSAGAIMMEELEEDRVAGGSSGGIRLPASYCGVIGFKPSYGQCSRWGLVAYANSLDTVGILTRTVDDSKLVYDLISKYDVKDSTSIPPEVREFNNSIPSFFNPKNNNNPNDLNGLRVGIPKEFFVAELNKSIIDLWRKGISYLRSCGATIVSISCPNTKYALPAYYILAPAEASSNLARYDGLRYGHRSDKDLAKKDDINSSSNNNNGGISNDGNDLFYANTRDEGFGQEVKRRIMLGAYTLTAGSYENYFLQAQKIRRIIQSDFDKIFQRQNPLSMMTKNRDNNKNSNYPHHQLVDVILTPVAMSTSPTLENCLSIPGTFSSTTSSLIKDQRNDDYDNKFVDAYVNDVFTVPANLAGIPAISIPFGKSPLDGYPIGLQLMAQYGDENTLLNVAKVLEEGGNDDGFNYESI